MKLKGELFKYGSLWYFIADGYDRPMFYNRFLNKWVLSGKQQFDRYWHRHVIGYVSIDKVMVK